MLLAASATYKFCVSKIYLELGCDCRASKFERGCCLDGRLSLSIEFLILKKSITRRKRQSQALIPTLAQIAITTDLIVNRAVL